MTTANVAPIKKTRRTHHWKAIAKTAQDALHGRELEAEKLNACLDIEVAARVRAQSDAVQLERAVRRWRLTAMAGGLFALLTLAALARAVFP